MVAKNELDFYPTPRQWRARQALDFDIAQDPKDPTMEVCYGGAKGGGKSFFFVFWVLEYARWVIQHFDLKPSNNPPHIGFMGRKLGVDFTGTTLASWRENIPESCYEFRGSGDKEVKHVIIDGCVAVDYGGLDRQVNINKFNSAEYGFVAIDQAEETTIDDVAVLKASRRKKIDGKALPFRGLWTANPAACWLKDDFIINPKPNHIFVQALPGDNEHLPASYIETLKASFGHRPELLQAYLYGSWDSFEGVAQVIKNIWIEEAKQRSCYGPVIKRYLVCDPARFGDDETVILLLENAEILEKHIMPQTRSTDISTRLAILSSENDDCQIVVEVTGAGLGDAVVDELIGMKREVIEFNPSCKSTELVLLGTNPKGGPEYKPKYANLRAEAWCKSAIILSSGQLNKEQGILVECKNMYQTLQSQLCVPYYKFKGSTIIIEKKEDIKKRLGRSPDHADTYVIGLWAWDRVEAREDPEDVIKYKYRDDESLSPMRMC